MSSLIESIKKMYCSVVFVLNQKGNFVVDLHKAGFKQWKNNFRIMKLVFVVNFEKWFSLWFHVESIYLL